jgi:hypothetical protein
MSLPASSFRHGIEVIPIDPERGTGAIADKLAKLLACPSPAGADLMAVVAEHPLVGMAFVGSLGGRDGLRLREHSLAVIGCYENWFEDRCPLLLRNAEFKLLLCLHDLGKPRAMAEGTPERQHEYTCALIDSISPDLGLAAGLARTITHIVGGDPIGRCLNSKHLLPVEEAAAQVLQLASALAVEPRMAWNTLLTYYQCDAFGYESLRRKVFLADNDGKTIFSDDKRRFLFGDSAEMDRFDLLERAVLQADYRI